MASPETREGHFSEASWRPRSGGSILVAKATAGRFGHSHDGEANAVPMIIELPGFRPYSGGSYPNPEPDPDPDPAPDPDPVPLPGPGSPAPIPGFPIEPFPAPVPIT